MAVSTDGDTFKDFIPPNVVGFGYKIFDRKAFIFWHYVVPLNN